MITTGSYQTILVDVDHSVGRVTLNRPDKLNPLSTLTLGELTRAFAELDQVDGLKVVIVSGVGRAFSAGADVTFFGSPTANQGLSPRDAADAGRLMAESLERLRAVTIAAIWGHCVGGAVVLAAGCDLRIAAEDTRFSIPEVDLGIPLAWGGIPRLVREIGPARTKELVMTCRPFGAEEAAAMGFLNRVVPANAVMAGAEALASELAAKSALTLQATKRHVNAVSESISNTGRNWNDADSLVAALHDPESRECARQYLERLSNSPRKSS
ncbi:MAG: enoyl-CoA hydratase/isomerase family protein [Acidimicrobiia bacterium]|nr:enoyl-CoA hydratase/isomerase family protein [Acidimicrobiia bacterium]